MAEAQPVTLSVFRNDPLRLTLNVDCDLRGGTVNFAVRAYPDQGGTALLGPLSGATLAVSSTVLASGVRLVDVSTDTDGVVHSVIEITDTKAHVQALPAAAEAGADVTLYFDLEWTLATGVAAPFAAVEQTTLFGSFIVRGSANA